MTLIGTFFARVSLPSLMLGLVFFALSLTPSLIPRGPVVQGLLGGVVISIGYLLGRIIALFWQALDLPQIRGRPARIFAAILGLITLALAVWTVTSSLDWQNALRAKMGMDPAEAQHLWQITAIASLTFFLALVLGALISALFHW
ncbi:MAG: alpha/beta-hydrolase N-terminal domain-containing protein, partial [Pseudomonadota bacterium]